MTSMKTCTTCQVTKPLSEFHKNRKSPDGHLTRCRLCCSIRLRAIRRAGWRALPLDYVTGKFWPNVSKSKGCWLWTGSVHPSGYGQIVIKGSVMGAHRFSYEFNVGPIGEGMEIDHTCHTPACVNPSHLRQTTDAENQQNRQGAMRNSKSGVRGVSLHAATGKWQVHVNSHGKHYYGGLHEHIEDAEAAARRLRLDVMTHNDSDRLTLI